MSWFVKRFLISLGIGVLVTINPFTASADVTVCGENPRQALNNLTPGEDLLLCPEVVHDFGGGNTRIGDMQGSFVRSSVPGVLAPVRGNFNFDGVPSHNITFSELHVDGINGTAQAFRFDSGTSNITIQDSIIENYQLAVYVKRRSGADTIWNIKIHRNIIRNNTSQGVLGGGPGYEVVSNRFYDNGTNGIFDHDIYFGCGDPGDGSPCPILIKGNYVTGSSRDGNGDCYGTQIVAHSYHNGTIVENNRVIEPDGYATRYCYGIGINDNGPQTESMTNVTIRNNIVANVGRVGINLRGITGGLVENNIITHHSNVDVGSKIGVYIEEENSPGTTSGDIEIRNNIIDFTGSVNSGINIEQGVDVPIVISNNFEYYGEYSYFDLDEDGSLGIGDIGMVLGALNTVNGNNADLNNDGGVGFDDLGLLLRVVSPFVLRM